MKDDLKINFSVFTEMVQALAKINEEKYEKLEMISSLVNSDSALDESTNVIVKIQGILNEQS